MAIIVKYRNSLMVIPEIPLATPKHLFPSEASSSTGAPDGYFKGQYQVDCLKS